MLKMVIEKMNGVIGAMGMADRIYVIEEPINETGICKQFVTKEKAENYIKKSTTSDEDIEKMRKSNVEDYQSIFKIKREVTKK